MAGETQTGIRVEIHLDQETLSLVSPHGALGTWTLEALGVSARPDGFHLKIEGEELILSTSDDARFALALGIRSSTSPKLNRQLAHARDGGVDVEDRLTPTAPEMRYFAPVADADEVPGSDSVAIAVLVASGALALAAVQAFTTSTPLRLGGFLPIWTLWLMAAIGLGAGGIAMLNRMPHSRTMVAGGAIIGALGLIGALLSITSSSFSWLGDGAFLGGTGTLLALLLWGVDRLNRGE